MEAKNKKEYESFVEYYKQKLGRDLTEKELDSLKKQFDNPIFKDITLRKGEGDIRKLPLADYRQLQNRNERDNLAYLNFINGELSDIYVLLIVIARKLGVQDVFKEMDEISDEVSKKVGAK